MAKTNPIGVRFDKELMEMFYKENFASTPQGVLSFLESFFRTSKQVNSRDLTVSNKNAQESQNKPHTDTKKEIVEETMPEGLNWKERMEWTHNYKQKLKNLKT